MLPRQQSIATQLPHAVGIAWASLIRGLKGVTLAYCGDGATSEGDFHEACNLAGVMDVPLVLVIINNQYAISTPISKQTRAARLADRARGYGFPGVAVGTSSPSETGWVEPARDPRSRLVPGQQAAVEVRNPSTRALLKRAHVSDAHSTHGCDKSRTSAGSSGSRRADAGGRRQRAGRRHGLELMIGLHVTRDGFAVRKGIRIHYRVWADALRCRLRVWDSGVPAGNSVRVVRGTVEPRDLPSNRHGFSNPAAPIRSTSSEFWLYNLVTARCAGTASWEHRPAEV